MAKLDSALLTALQACRDHAQELLTSARAVLTSGQHNIAYHLAVLACEEMGKCELLIIEHMEAENDVPSAWPKKHASDHTQKLFWFFFEAAFRSRNVSRETFENAKELARRIHFKRLASLYVDTTPDGVSVPRLQVTVEEAQELIDYAAIRLEVAEKTKPSEEVSEDDLASQRWLNAAMRDEHLSKLIFSEASFRKMLDVDSPREWVKWLQAQVKEATDRGNQVLEKELERNRALPFESTRDKWHIRFRLSSASHSIRPSAINDFNRRIKLLHLSPVNGKKRELLVELRIGDNTPMQNLWPVGLDISRLFVAAINMATMGLFWFELADQKTRWYEKVVDLDNRDVDVGIDANPGHRIDWGERAVFDEQCSKQTLLNFSALAQEIGNRHSFVHAYLRGVTELAKSDIHFAREAEAFGAFATTLQRLMLLTGELNEGEPLAPAIDAYVRRKGTELGEDSPMLSFIQAFDETRGTRGTIELRGFTPEHAAMMKAITDGYFAAEYRQLALDRLGAGKDGPGDQSEAGVTT